MGLIKSCSHRAAIDAEIIEEYTGHVLIKSTNYVSLWISLLKAHQCNLFDLYLSKTFLILYLTNRALIEKSIVFIFQKNLEHRYLFFFLIFMNNRN